MILLCFRSFISSFPPHAIFTFKHRFVPAHSSQFTGLRIPGNTCWRCVCWYETNHHIKLLVYIMDYTWLHTRLDDTSELATSLPSNSTWRTFFHNSNPLIALQSPFMYPPVTTSTLLWLCPGSVPALHRLCIRLLHSLQINSFYVGLYIVIGWRQALGGRRQAEGMPVKMVERKSHQ